MRRLTLLLLLVFSSAAQAVDFTPIGGGFSSSQIDTSAELAAIVTDETGSGGALVFATAPTLTGVVGGGKFAASDTYVATTAQFYNSNYGNGNGLQIDTANAVNLVQSNTCILSAIATYGVRCNGSYPLGFTNGAANGGAADVTLYRDAANALALRNSTSAQAFHIYNTYTDASNYERLALYYSANVAYLAHQNAGTGSARELVIGANQISFALHGTTRWQINSAGPLIPNADNTTDIGYSSSSFRPRSIYVGTNVDTPAITGGNSKALTESAATAFVRVAAASGSQVGGRINYTVIANDASDYQSRSGSVNFAIVNKAGTETVTLGTVSSEAAAVSAGTLTVSFDADTSPTNAVDFRANAVSSLTQTTLTIRYSVEIFGPAVTITAQ